MKIAATNTKEKNLLLPNPSRIKTPLGGSTPSINPLNLEYKLKNNDVIKKQITLLMSQTLDYSLVVT